MLLRRGLTLALDVVLCVAVFEASQLAPVPYEPLATWARVAAVVLVLRLADALLYPRLWQLSLRRKYAAAAEECPLDIAEGTAAHYKLGYHKLVKDIEESGLPEYIRTFVLSAVLCRGAKKAFYIREELVNYKKVIRHLLLDYEQNELALRRMLSLYHHDSNVQTADKEVTAIAFHRQLSVTRGALHILRDVRTWTKRICLMPRLVPDSYSLLFQAGDQCIWKMPTEGFECKALADRVSAFLSTQTEATMTLIAQSEQFDEQQLRGKHRCRVCKSSFGRAWIGHMVCFLCDYAARKAGRCPRERNQPQSICPHSRKCVSCEAASCQLCRVYQCRDENVVSLIEHLRPAQIFIDFDMTLCNTKSGCRPVIGKHQLSPELSAYCRTRPQDCTVLTRQRKEHRDDIARFLSAQDLPIRDIVCLGSTSTRKGEYIRSVLLQDCKISPSQVLLIDDSVAEIMHPSARQIESLHCAVFTLHENKKKIQ